MLGADPGGQVVEGLGLRPFIAGIVGSNLVKGMDFCVLCLLSCVGSVLLRRD